jgi:hypothetical protein
MSIFIHLEIESGLTEGEVKSLLLSIPTAKETSPNRYFIESSDLNVHARQNAKGKKPIAEGIELATFLVGTEIIFVLGRKSSREEMGTINQVVEAILIKTNLQFALSFQYDVIYALRCTEYQSILYNLDTLKPDSNIIQTK